MYHTMLKGLQSELRVKKYYESLGYEVTHHPHRGPDLVCVRGEDRFTVEVKTANQKKRRMPSGRVEGRGWMINKLRKSQHTTDLIAVVFPDVVVVQRMEEFAKKNTGSGGKVSVGMLRWNPPEIPDEDMWWHKATVARFP